jgi:hypothetical protein
VNRPAMMRDQSSGDGTTWSEEDIMTALIVRTQSKIARWFKEFRERNRPPYRWYENDTIGMS